MKYYGEALLILAILFGLSCGAKKGSSGLNIGVSNSNPPVVSVGSGTSVNGTSVTPPYFILNEMTFQWTGTGGLNILLIEMKTVSKTDKTTVNCAISGDQLVNLFSTRIFPLTNNQIIIPGVGYSVSATTGLLVADPAATGALQVGSKQIPCSGFTLPNPVPDSFKTQVQVKITGQIIPDPLANPSNGTGLVTATLNITPGY
jgi:hypothetical protein